MQKRYSQMTKEELVQTIATLKEQARKVGGKEQYNEYEVLYRKMIMAESYIMSSDDIIIGKVYTLKNHKDSTFHVTRLNGIFAWGYQNDNKEESGVPIALLAQQ